MSLEVNKVVVLVLDRIYRQPKLTLKGTYTEHAILTPPNSMYPLPFACEIKPVLRTDHQLRVDHLPDREY
jgi:hypothetical protein